MAIEIIAKLKPKNKGKFALMDACDIDVNGTRLDKKLESIGTNITLDKTLSNEGEAADAKAVGDILGDIHSVLTKI